MVTLGQILKNGAIAAPLTWGAAKAIPYLATRFGDFAASLLPQDNTVALNGMANIAMSRNSDLAATVVDFTAQVVAYAALGATAYGLERATYSSLFD